MRGTMRRHGRRRWKEQNDDDDDEDGKVKRMIELKDDNRRCQMIFGAIIDLERRSNPAHKKQQAKAVTRQSSMAPCPEMGRRSRPRGSDKSVIVSDGSHDDSPLFSVNFIGCIAIASHFVCSLSFSLSLSLSHA